MKAKVSILLATTGLMALTACTDPYGGTSAQPTNAQSGALAGAVIGGVLGASTDGDNRLARTAIGAAIGAAAGAAIGTQLDRQAADLQRDIGNDRVQIINTGSELIVRMPQDILFATDSASVRPDLQNDLYALADNLNQYPNTRVDIIGHTDNTGSATYNQDLSARRAAAVAAVLRSGGVSGSRIVSYGRGENEPIASNLNEAGRAQNRRVDIIIRPVQ